MGVFEDGTGYPSCIDLQDRSYGAPGGSVTMADTDLRVGEVVAILPPDAKTNVSKKETEYIVSVLHREADGLLSPTPYRCIKSDTFGGVSDHVRHSLRQRSSDKDGYTITDGAIVLIACINGDKNNSVIINGLRQPNRTEVDVSDFRYFDFLFNGVAVNITDDGGLKITVNGATKVNGDPDDRSNNIHGSYVNLNSEGVITISDNNGQSIEIKPETKQITLNSDQQISNTETSWTINTQTANIVADKVNLGGKNLVAMSDGVVVASGIDTFTGSTYGVLGSSSKIVMAKK